MFSTDEGRLELSSSCGYQRLLVVTLNRGHIYKDIDEVKAELSAKVMELAPRGTLEKDVSSFVKGKHNYNMRYGAAPFSGYSRPSKL